MPKYGPKEGPCGWDASATALDMEVLHKVLNCAAGRGCVQCVRCSERALERVLRMTRKNGELSFLGLERLEMEMDMGAALGM